MEPRTLALFAGHAYFTTKFFNSVLHNVQADSGSIGLFRSPEEHFEDAGKVLLRNANTIISKGNIRPQVIDMDLYGNFRYAVALHVAIFDRIRNKVAENLCYTPRVAVKIDSSLYGHIPNHVLRPLQIVQIAERVFNDLCQFNLTDGDFHLEVLGVASYVADKMIQVLNLFADNTDVI